jgi:hypothetical protein
MMKTYDGYYVIGTGLRVYNDNDDDDDDNDGIFEELRSAGMKMRAFCDIAPRSLEVNGRFRHAY